MTKFWWPPWGRKAGKAKKLKAPGKKGRDRHLADTRRIVRHLKKEVLRSEQKPGKVIAPPKKPTVQVNGNVVHVNFHRCHLLKLALVAIDPVTKRTRRIARRFSKSEVYYRSDGRLLD